MSNGWEFIAPSTVIVRGGSHPAVYRLYIDLRAVTESGAGDPVMLASFLQVGMKTAVWGFQFHNIIQELVVEPEPGLGSFINMALFDCRGEGRLPWPSFPSHQSSCSC